MNCQCTRTSSLTGAVKGHGPLWMELGQAVEKEANRSLLGFKHQRFMGVGPDVAPRKQELASNAKLERRRQARGLTKS